jgi:hypothetical protein
MMTARIGKRRSYEELFQRLDTTLGMRVFLEASWIAYAILEDRADSALAKTGGPVPRKTRPMLGDKLAELSERIATDALLRTELWRGATLEAAKNWKNKRNPLMHSMADLREPWHVFEKRAERLAMEGRSVARDMASAVMRLRKKRFKGR